MDKPFQTTLQPRIPDKRTSGMDNRLFSYINWGLLACMLLLYLVGVGNLYSASGTRVESGLAFNSFYQRQLIWGLCGVVCMLLAMVFDYRQLRNLAWPFFLITVFLLLLVPIAGKTVYGAKRWISLGFMSLQPSEMAKLSVLVLVARLLARDSRPLGWKNFCSVLCVGLIPCGLIIVQPDLGTTLLILLIMGGMILFHGLKGYVLKTCLLVAPAAVAFMWFVGMHDYQRQRILTFLDPGNDPRGTGYHIIQSRIAIGSGELWGKGFREGTQSQLRFLPERHSASGKCGVAWPGEYAINRQECTNAALFQGAAGRDTCIGRILSGQRSKIAAGSYRSVREGSRTLRKRGLAHPQAFLLCVPMPWALKPWA